MAIVKIRNMEEFSAASGISRPTVSRYFNDPGSVRKSTREKIERALTELDYRPNMFAMNVNRRNPRNIGIIVPYIVDPFFAEVVRQIELRCVQAGYWAIVLSSHGQSSLEANALDTLRSLKISGAILAPLGDASDPHRIEQLSGEVPVVFLDSRTSDQIPFAGTDNAQSISLMVDYLCRSGEPPCFLEMPRVNQNADRAEGRLSGDHEAPRVRARRHNRGRGRRMELRGDGLQRGKSHPRRKRFPDTYRPVRERPPGDRRAGGRVFAGRQGRNRAGLRLARRRPR